MADKLIPIEGSVPVIKEKRVGPAIRTNVSR